MLKNAKNKISSFFLKIDNMLEQADDKMAELETSSSTMAEKASVKVVENKIKLFHQTKHDRSIDENIDELAQIITAYDTLSSSNQVLEKEIVNISRELKIKT